MRAFVCALLLCLLLPSVAQVVTAGKHKQLSVVPVPGKMTLDGNLDEWDLSGEILCYDYPETAERRHARLAAMYDKDALYLGAYFKDFSPLMNMVNPRTDPVRGWDADCLQFRILGDVRVGYPPAPTTEMALAGCDCMLWFYTGTDEPSISINPLTLRTNGTMQYLPCQAYIGKDSGLAFRKVENGYYLEARLPWARLNMPGAPEPGSKRAVTVQFLWGNEKGTKYATSVNELTVGGTFSYQTYRSWGALVFEPAGKLAREREELPRPLEVAKTLAFTYTLPAARRVSLGVYDATGNLVRTLVTNEARPAGTITERWDGLNDFGDPLPPGPYTFKGLSHTGIGQQYVLAIHNAGTPPWVTADGMGSWGGDHGVPLDACAFGDRVYLLWDSAEAGWNLIACTLDGKKQWGTWCAQKYTFPNSIATDGKTVFVSQQDGITAQDAATGRPAPFQGDRRGIDIEGGGVTDLAYAPGHLYALAKGKIYDIALPAGKVVKHVVVGEAKGLAALSATQTLTIRADGCVCRVDMAAGTVWPLFNAALVHPYDLTLSRDGSKLYISDQGRGEMSVKVFSFPAGKALGTVGKPGGRPAVGAFDPNGLFFPGGLAFDSADRLWVTEMDATPKRISVWQPEKKGAKLVNQFFGASAYSVNGSVDPAHPEYVYVHNTRWIVDYDKKTVVPDATLCRPGWDGPQPHFGSPNIPVQVRHANGRTFLFQSESLWEWKGDRAVPLVQFGREWTWYDLNHDGFMQEAEYTRNTGPFYNFYWGTAIGPDLAIEEYNGAAGYLRPVKEWRDGLPIYATGKELQPLFSGKEAAWTGIWDAGRKRCYKLETNDGYYSNDMRRNGIACYTADGTRQWRFKAGIGMDVGDVPLTKPGEVRGAQKFLGLLDSPVGELVTVNGYYGNYNMLNEDGLFVSEFCHDNRRGHPLDSTVVLPEGFSGYIFRHATSGKVYLIGGDSDARIWEITGLDTLRRFNGTFGISAKDVEGVVKALADYQQAGGTATTTALRRVAKAPVVDGSLDEWDLAQAVHIPAGEGRGGSALAAYDAANLYVAYRVADDSPFTNAGKDWAYMFKTGDLVDLILGTDPNLDTKRPAGKGDLRLLFAAYQGKPVAVLNQKAATGGPAAPLTFTSPTGTEPYERVALLDDAKVAVKTTPDGYTLEAAIPLATLGFAPSTNKLYPIDFGILYGDPGGAKTILRAYWANRHTTITGDIPTESRIQPAYLGKAQVE
jgi:hypothetical protein